MYYLKCSKTEKLKKHSWKQKTSKPQAFLLSQRNHETQSEFLTRLCCCTTSPLTLTDSKRVWSVFAEQQSLLPNFPLVLSCRLLCEPFPSAKNKTRPCARPYLTGSSADWTCEILKKIRAVQSSWPAAPHLQPPADQLPDWLAVCVSRGPEWQTSIQPEAGTAGYQATPLTDQLTCCLAAGMDGWLWMLLAACLGFFYSMAL